MRLGRRIDFARHRLPRSRAMMAACGVTLLGASILFSAVSKVAEQRDGLHARIRSTREASDQPSAVNVSPQESMDPARLGAINAAIALLNVPWAQTLTAIAKHRPAEVAVLKIEPYASEKRIRLVVGGQASSSLFEFASGLVEEPLFVSMTPIRQQRVDEDGHASLRLTFDLEWRL